MVVWCSEPKEAQRSIACSQHQKQETKMKFAAGVCCTLCGNMQNRCHFCLPSVQDNAIMRTNCNCLTPECIVITPECNEMALIYIYIIYISLIRYSNRLPRPFRDRTISVCFRKPFRGRGFHFRGPNLVLSPSNFLAWRFLTPLNWKEGIAFT